MIFFSLFAWTELKFVSFTCKSFMVVLSQMRTVPSYEHDASRFLSAALYCTPKIVSKCPVSVVNSDVWRFRL